MRYIHSNCSDYSVCCIYSHYTIYTPKIIMTAEEYYKKGNEYRQRGDWQMAINNYIQAIQLDPQSPAVEAKQMLDDILNFYHKDYYNP